MQPAYDANAMDEGGTEQAGDGRVGGKARAAALYAALTLLMAYPLWVHPTSTWLTVGPDEDLLMWTLAWDTHAIVSQPLSVFDANIYYPQTTTLAYSENMLGSVPFSAPVLWLTGNPVLALNVVALLSIILCGLGAYVLARRLGMDPAAAVLCGLIFAFSPARFFRIGQLHLTTVQWIPFGLASLHAYLDGGRGRDLKLAAFFFTLQALTSGHGAVFATLGMLGLVAWRVALGEPVESLRRLRDLGVTGALILLPAALVFVPYRRVQVEMGLQRSLENWAPTPESFLASPAVVQTWLLSLVPDADILARASSYLFPGFLPILLAAAALSWRRSGPRRGTRWTRAAAFAEMTALAGLALAVAVMVTGPIRLEIGDTLLLSARNPRRAYLVVAVATALRAAMLMRVPFEMVPRLRRWRDGWRRWAAAHRRGVVPFYGLLTLVSVLLSVGPPLGVWPLVYWLPGLNFIRVPSRFMILAVLGLAVLAAIGFGRLTARARSARRLAAIVGALLVIEFITIPLPTRTYAVEIPAVDRWLDSRPKPFVVAELPVDGSDRIQSTYMLHTLAHWQKTVHGHSGLRPELHVELYDQLRSFPDETSLASLQRLGVDYVVIHPEFYGPGEWEAVRERLEEFGAWLELLHEEDGGRVYTLRSPAAGRG